MSSDNKRMKIAGLAALALPFLVMGTMTASHITARHGGDPVWQVKIAAYDPRDLLYGHYLRYRYDWQYEGGDQFAECLQLSPSGTGNKDPKVQLVDCGTAADAGSSVIRLPEAENQYLIPEEKSMELDSLFREDDHVFRIELVAHANQSISVRNLYVDDIPLEDFLRSWTPTETTVP